MQSFYPQNNGKYWERSWHNSFITFWVNLVREPSEGFNSFRFKVLARFTEAGSSNACKEMPMESNGTVASGI